MSEHNPCTITSTVHESESAKLLQPKMTGKKEFAAFLAIIKGGRTPLEAARELGISGTRLKRHIADAIMQKELQGLDFYYETVWARDLPRSLALVLKATDADIIKATLLEDGSVTINILK